jgi:hypothetical protein
MKKFDVEALCIKVWIHTGKVRETQTEGKAWF